MADVKKFIISTYLHQKLVKSFVDYVCNQASENAKSHDMDKISYAHEIAEKPGLDSEQVLYLWKAEGYPMHRSKDLAVGSRHHVENIYDISSFIEMVCDWIAANLVRSSDALSIEDSFQLAFESWAATIKSLDWGKLLANTVRELLSDLEGGK